MSLKKFSQNWGKMVSAEHVYWGSGDKFQPEIPKTVTVLMLHILSALPHSQPFNGISVHLPELLKRVTGKITLVTASALLSFKCPKQ